MSQPSFESVSAPSVLTRKSPWNIYTMLLIIALISLLLAMLFLYLEIREYGGFGQLKGPTVGALTPLWLRRVSRQGSDERPS
ncbi:MAG: hypothetical protein AAF961_11030 [Planctomycetota bacterium]